MYYIKCINTDGAEYPLMLYGDPEYTAAEIEIEEGVNKCGTLSFLLPATNPNFDRIKKLESEVVVTDLDGSVEIFRGRCMSDETDFYNTKNCYCEGVLAYLLDTRQGPYLHTGSIRNFIAMLLDEHNRKVQDKQKIYIGNVTVIDPNNYMRRESSGYEAPLKIIQDKVVAAYGGLLHVRRDNGKNYLDYLADYPVSDQVARFGENILDLTKYAKAETVRTAIIPLGAKNEDTGERVKITSVNGGKDYLVDTALVAEYGWIEDTVEFDDVTLPENLLAKGRKYLEQCRNMTLTVELDALDARLLGMDVRRITPGMMVKVESAPHGLDTYFLCTSKTTNLLSPDQDRIVLGNEIETYTESVSRAQRETQEQIEAGDATLAQEIQAVRDEFNESIENASGLYQTGVKQADGSTVYYYHDKPKLADSTIQMVFNAAGFAISADGGNNWYGMQVDGDFIARILDAEGVNANWIRTGTINADLIKAGTLELAKIKLSGTLQDEAGKNSWDMKSGELHLAGGLELTGSFSTISETTGREMLTLRGPRITFNNLIEENQVEVGEILEGKLTGSEAPAIMVTLTPGNVFAIGNRMDESLSELFIIFGDGVDYDNKGCKIGLSAHVNARGFNLYQVGDIQLKNGQVVKSVTTDAAAYPQIKNISVSGNGSFVIAQTTAGEFKHLPIVTKAGKTGRATFSDGSYLDFTNGLLTGGKTSEGGTL